MGLLVVLGPLLAALILGILYEDRDRTTAPAGLTLVNGVLSFQAGLTLHHVAVQLGDWPALPPGPALWPPATLFNVSVQPCADSPADNGCQWIDPIQVGLTRGNPVVIISQRDRRPPKPVFPLCLTLPTAQPTNEDLVVSLAGVLLNDTLGLRGDFCAWRHNNSYSVPVADPVWWSSGPCAGVLNALGFVCSVDSALDLFYTACPTTDDASGQWVACAPCGDAVADTGLALALAVPADAPVRPDTVFQPYVYSASVAITVCTDGPTDITLEWQATAKNTADLSNVQAQLTLVALTFNADTYTLSSDNCTGPRATHDRSWTPQPTMTFSTNKTLCGYTLTLALASTNLFANEAWTLTSITALPCCDGVCRHESIDGLECGHNSPMPPAPSACTPTTIPVSPLSVRIADSPSAVGTTPLVVALLTPDPTALHAPPVALQFTAHFTVTSIANISIVALDGFPLIPPPSLTLSSFIVVLGDPTAHYSDWPAAGPLLHLELSLTSTATSHSNNILLTGMTVVALDTLACLTQAVSRQDTTGPPQMWADVVLDTAVLVNQTTAQAWEAAFQASPNRTRYETMTLGMYAAPAAPVQLNLTEVEFTALPSQTLCSQRYNNTASNRYVLSTTATPASGLVWSAALLVWPNSSLLTAWPLFIQMPVAECITLNHVRVRFCGGMYPCSTLPVLSNVSCATWRGSTTTLVPVHTPVLLFTPNSSLTYINNPFSYTFDTLAWPIMAPDLLTSTTGVELECAYTCSLSATGCVLMPFNSLLYSPATGVAFLNWTSRVDSSAASTLFTTTLNGAAVLSAPFTLTGLNLTIRWTLVEGSNHWKIPNNDLRAYLQCRLRLVSPACPPYALLGGALPTVQGWTQRNIATVPPNDGVVANFMVILNLKTTQGNIIHSTGSVETGNPLAIAGAIGLELLYWNQNNNNGYIGTPLLWTITAGPNLTALASISGIQDSAVTSALVLCRRLIYPTAVPVVHYFDSALIAVLKTLPPTLAASSLVLAAPTGMLPLTYAYRYIWPDARASVATPFSNSMQLCQS